VASAMLTAQQVQDLLEVDASTVYRMASDGRLPAVRIGRQWRFPTEAIERLLVPDGAPLPRQPPPTRPSRCPASSSRRRWTWSRTRSG
jgi:excisionase family DNA binding protein